MTLIHELDLDIPKMYLHTKNYVPRPRLSKVTASTDRERETLRQTDRQTDASECITNSER